MASTFHFQRMLPSPSTSQRILLSPSTSATRSVGLRSLFSSYCNCFNCCSVKSNSMASSPIATNGFQRIAPSPFATNAFEQVGPSIRSTCAASSSPSAFDGIAPSNPSTSAPSSLPYDVFINHRGPDVKRTLATDIYDTLTSIGFQVFLDDKKLELGDCLPIEIEEAMSKASVHIAIFSKNYAQSAWCLAELAFMLETGTKIIPIFYHVQPDVLRWAVKGKGIYADSFSQHEMKDRYTSEQLQRWKEALHNVSFYSGYIINNDEDERRLLKIIVNSVLDEVKNVPLEVAKYPVGLDEAVEDFEKTTLQSAKGHQSAQTVGIWGMGGSGKTTLAKYLYNRRYSSFQRFSFLFDIRDAATKGMLHDKQKKLFDDLGVEYKAFDNIEEGKGILARRLRSVRVFIVLDDVDHIDQLHALLPPEDTLGRGSLIVVTTRENGVLTRGGISAIYKMRALDASHAMQLFCWHGFLKPFPLDGFGKLAEQFVEACDGLPLSLTVLGGQLYNKSEEYWESQLQKIVRILPNDIKYRLKISYAALDDEEKQIFLDIACFFIGEEKSSAIAAWDGLGWSGLHSWESLLNKCLVELNNSDCIRMHDHLRDLGREIANNQSPFRLWSFQQIDQIINVDNGVQETAIRGIIASKKEVGQLFYRRVKLNTKALLGSRTHSLLGGKPNISRGSCSLALLSSPARTLLGEKLNISLALLYNLARSLLGGKLNISRGSCSLALLSSLTLLCSPAHSLLGLKILCVIGNFNYQAIGDELVWLRWYNMGQRNLRFLSSLKNLRVLELYEHWSEYEEHHLEELWESDSNAPVQLRELVIFACYKFQGFPKSIGCLRHLKKIALKYLNYQVRSLPEELCLLQSLEHLDLSGCRRLSSLPSSFGYLTNLKHLDLSGCGELSSLPSSFGYLRNLRHLDLSNCWNLTSLPDSFKKLTLLQHLNFRGCCRLTLESDILENMTKLEYLNFSFCTQLEELPRHITNQAFLTELHLENTDSLRELPVNIGQLSKLQTLNIKSPKLTSLPTSIGDLSSLTSLKISNCPMLTCLPESLARLNLLENFEMWKVGLKSLPIRQLINLQTLQIWMCPISELDLGGGLLTCLKRIVLRRTEVSKISISEDCCPSLETLSLRDNDHLREIEVLPKTLNNREGCPELDVLPSFAQPAFLREFELRGCYGVKKIQGLEHCRALETLKEHTRWEEAGIKSLERMERLRKVELTAISKAAVEGCIQSMQNLRKWPEETIICTRTVPDAASVVNSFDFSNLSVVHSLANQKIRHLEILRMPSDARRILLCFVVNSESPNDLSRKRFVFKLNDTEMELEKGKWVLTALLTQHSELFIRETRSSGLEGEVEKRVVVMGEEERVLEAFTRLWTLL